MLNGVFKWILIKLLVTVFVKIWGNLPWCTVEWLTVIDTPTRLYQPVRSKCFVPSFDAHWLLCDRFVRNRCFWLVEMVIRRRIPFGNLSLNKGAGCDLKNSFRSRLVLLTALNTAGNMPIMSSNIAMNVYLKLAHIPFIILLYKLVRLYDLISAFANSIG